MPPALQPVTSTTGRGGGEAIALCAAAAWWSWRQVLLPGGTGMWPGCGGNAKNVQLVRCCCCRSCALLPLLCSFETAPIATHSPECECELAGRHSKQAGRPQADTPHLAAGGREPVALQAHTMHAMRHSQRNPAAFHPFHAPTKLRADVHQAIRSRPPL